MGGERQSGEESTLSLSQREQIDRLADQFEREFKAGEQPRIEAYLEQAPELRPHLLTELMGLEVEFRQAAGQQPTPEEYRQRFPDAGEIIDAVFAVALSAGAGLESTRGRPPRPDDTDTEDDPIPERLGRYTIQRRLGRGGFGVVYLAHDPQLDRPVALKVPRRERFKSPEQVGDFIKEARTAANLKHPGLVTVYDVQEEDGWPYIVQEFIEGQNLAAWAGERKPSYQEIARLFIGIADAVGYAHQQGLTHCDLKLANVLMDTVGEPHVADFGLAMHESVQALHRGEVFGTPEMMAPEQVRGETHRFDDRTDIWAMGVMLYEVLTGRRPFSAKEQRDLFEDIQKKDPRPPRQIDRSVPREVERICLRCLSKRQSERYSTTDDLREDLQAWLDEEPKTASSTPSAQSTTEAAAPDSSSGSSIPAKVIPKGLRSFDAEDADFFLDLLPGPRDRDGLPESIRFWKRRIEELDPDNTFSVGLIYGPSGCGKSSLVKAGLLPRLGESVVPIFVEATGADTEVRLLKQLRKHLPQLPGEVDLPAACKELRLTGAGRGRKVLLVVDQFEQWLHVHAELKGDQLVDALRQCEGSRLQAIVLVRDDFYLSVNRVFQDLEIRLLEGENYSAIDLFDPDHARRVLKAFGRAYGKLDEELSAEQEAFLTQAVADLAEESKIISVRLALFADMMKSRPWVPSSLEDVGGVGGLGVTFLEETFAAKTAPPSHRVHGKAVRGVLKSLLPDAGTDIKGAMQSTDQLREAAEYEQEPRQFEELLQILDSEVRLITPTDPEGADQAPDDASDAKYYQLTHDYLVASLRDWLREKDKRSFRGRATLALQDYTDRWVSFGRKRSELPQRFTLLRILLGTSSKNSSDAAQAMLADACQRSVKSWIGLLVIVSLGVASSLFYLFGAVVFVTGLSWKGGFGGSSGFFSTVLLFFLVVPGLATIYVVCCLAKSLAWRRWNRRRWLLSGVALVAFATWPILLPPLCALHPAIRWRALSGLSTLCEDEDLDLASGYVSAALRISPTVSVLYAQRGRIRMRQRQYDDACSDLVSAIVAEACSPTPSCKLLRWLDYKMDVKATCSHCLRAFDLSTPAIARRHAKELTERTPACGWTYAVRGEANALLGRREAAIKDFTEAIRRLPNIDGLYQRRALVYVKMNALSRAIEDFESAIKTGDVDSEFLATIIDDVTALEDEAPDEVLGFLALSRRLNPDDPKPFLATGTVYSHFGRYTDAVKYYDCAIKLGSRETSWCYDLRGDAYYEMKKYELAIKSYVESAKHAAPDDWFWHPHVCDIAKECPDEVEKYYDTCISLRPKDAHMYSERAKLFFDQERYEEMIRDSVAALKLSAEKGEPDHMSLWSLRTVFDKVPDAAKAYLDVARQVDPSNGDFWSTYAELMSRVGNSSEAIAEYSRLINSKPTGVDYYVGRAQLYTDQDAFGLALSDLTTALNINASADIYLRRAEIYRTKREYSKALSDFRSAWDLAPSSTTVLAASTALKAMVLEVPDEVLVFLDECVQKRPSNECGYLTRGDCQVILGNYEAAIDDYSKSLDLSARNREAILGVHEPAEEVYRVKEIIVLSASTPEQAVKYFNKVIDYRPKAFEVYKARAELNYRRGKYADAIEDLTRVIEDGPKDPAAYYSRGLVHAELQDWGNASQDFHNARESGWRGSLDFWLSYALVQLRLGDEEGHRELCGQSWLLFRGARSEHSCRSIVWTTALSSLELPTWAVGFAKNPYGLDEADFQSLGVCGAVQYRQGHGDRALSHLDRAIDLHRNGGLPQHWLYLAMAHQECGNTEEASTWLEIARRCLDQMGIYERNEIPWKRRVELQLLLEEAESKSRGTVPQDCIQEN